MTTLLRSEGIVPTGHPEASVGVGSLSGHSGPCSLLRGSSGYGHLSRLATGELTFTHRSTSLPLHVFPTLGRGCGSFLRTAAKSLQSCLTVCDPIDGSPPGSPVPGILQARTLEWVAISFSKA